MNDRVAHLTAGTRECPGSRNRVLEVRMCLACSRTSREPRMEGEGENQECGGKQADIGGAVARAISD